MALDVSALGDFNNELAGEMLVKSIYTGNTVEYVTIKEGIKHKEPINLFEVGLNLQNGTCVSTPSGSATFSQREITVCPRTSFDGLCLKDMDKKFLGISGLGKGSYNETFAMASKYADLLVQEMQKDNESFIWNAEAGVSPAGCSSDGLKEILSSNTAGVVIAGTADATLANLDTMIAAMSEDIIDRDDLTIFMSTAKFQAFITALRTANNYHFDPSAVTNRKGLLEMQYPFAPNIKVVGTRGLSGSGRIVAGPAKEIVVGTDLMSDFSEFQMWYDINEDKLKHRMSTKLGVQVAYPEHWVSNDVA